MIDQPIFINEFQKGAKENANIGIGTLVGVETYTKKGVAQLARKPIKVSGSVVVDLPVYFADLSTSVKFSQGDSSHVYKSIDGGVTWTDISNPGSIGDAGLGLVVYEGYVFAFHGGNIDYLSAPYGVGDWTSNWQPNGTAPSLSGNISHFPFIFPNDNFVYFANSNKVGKLGFGTATTFNPGGTGGTDYFYNSARLTLPSFYTVTCISFLPVNFLALGTTSRTNTEVADIILWNPTLNTYETPLRLYSQATVGRNGVKQLINRNNVLYAVVGGSQSVFETNGTTFNLVADLSLHSNIRKTTGAQAQSPVFIDPKVSAIEVFGNKLLTGMSTSPGLSYPSGYGLFPCGVWSLAFLDDGVAIQCEYVVSTETIVAHNNDFSIGALKCVGRNKVLIGWKDDTFGFGIDLVSDVNFLDNLDSVIIESEMMEIGSPLEPAVIQTIQANLTRLLAPSQIMQFNYRTSFDQDFTLLQAFTVAQDGANTGYKITKNPIDATKFVQIQLQMATGTPNETFSPELRNIIIT